MAKLCNIETVSGRWYAVYTRPRWEKKVHLLLKNKEIESYCPLNKVRRKWSDRVKIVEEPLFKSYVFVKVTDDKRAAVRTTDGVINFIYWDGKPGIIKEKEIIAIKKFLDEHDQVALIKVDFKLNQKVVVTSGPLMDKEGHILEVKNRVAKVAIESMGYILVADIDKHKLTSAHH